MTMFGMPPDDPSFIVTPADLTDVEGRAGLPPETDAEDEGEDATS